MRFYISRSRALHPDNNAQYHKGTNGVNHHRIVGISNSEVGKHRVVEYRTRAEQFAEQCNRKKYPGVTHAVTEAIEDRFIRFVPHRECLKTSHYNAVRDNKAYKCTQHLIHRVVVSL